MRFAAHLSAFALAAVTLVQGAEITINVGEDATNTPGLFFTPANVTAAEGDIVIFSFNATGSNHTVAQSTFANPCAPAPNGFASGYVAVPATGGSPSTFNLTVTNASVPIWFYCAQETPRVHCSSGMVGAINAPATGNTFAAFLANASAVTAVTQPTPALNGNGATAAAFPTGAVGTNGSTNGTTNNNTSSSGGPAPTGAPDGGAGALTASITSAALVAAAAFGVALL